MADNTDNREGTGGEELPDDLKRLVDAAQQDAEDTDAQETAGEAPGHTVTSGPVSEEDKARSLIDMSTIANPHGSIIEDANGGEGTTVRAAYLGKEMAASFLEYSMSVIVSRALPDVRDGLKPVHRRILYAMNESGYTPNRPHMKSARTVGDVIGKYHPHGDYAVYDTMVRLAQRLACACRLSTATGTSAPSTATPPQQCVTPRRVWTRRLWSCCAIWTRKRSISSQTTTKARRAHGFAGAFPEPAGKRLERHRRWHGHEHPAAQPGRDDRCHVLMLDNPEVTTAELMKVLPGPDFPTGGIIMGKKGVLDAYETGRGSLTVRAKCEIEEGKNGKSSIVVKEIPYQVNRQRLLEKLGELVREKKLPEIANIHDGADRHGIDIIIELKKDAIPQVVLNKLFKHTQLQVASALSCLRWWTAFRAFCR